jgi:hypothetical protein
VVLRVRRLELNVGAQSDLICAPQLVIGKEAFREHSGGSARSQTDALSQMVASLRAAQSS